MLEQVLPRRFALARFQLTPIAVELVVPEAYGATRFTALFALAAHAHFQGERRGFAIALSGSLALVLATVVRGDAPLDDEVLAFYEVVFVLSASATGAVVGSLRTAESAGLSMLFRPIGVCARGARCPVGPGQGPGRGS
jgi:hypothetical protein